MSRLTIAPLGLRATGDTCPIDLRLTDVAGAAVDITGYTFSLGVNLLENPGAAANVFTVTGTITDATAGRFRFAISLVNANLLVLRTANAPYWFSVRATDSGGLVTTIMKGELPVTGPIAP